MNKILSILVVTSFMSPSAFATLSPDQVVDARGLTIAMSSNRIISRYISGRAPATPELFVEILKFVDKVPPGKVVFNNKVTEILLLAEEVGKHLNSLSPEQKMELRPIMNSLLNNYSVRMKSQIMLRLFNRFWFWSPDNLDYMARAVRNDRSSDVSTQLMWILEQATNEQRRVFFLQVPPKQPNKFIRWFPSALRLKYGMPVDTDALKSSLRMANYDRLKPEPIPKIVDGIQLETTADLYLQTWRQFRDDLPLEVCRASLNITARELEDRQIQ